MKRKKDEEELDALKQQIEKRKDVRKKQIEERAERERERAERAKVVESDFFERMSLNYNFYRKTKYALKKPQPTRRPKKMRKRRRH